MDKQLFIFLGRAGSGKGTQAKLLVEAFSKSDQKRKVLYVETGAEFRKFIDGPSYTAKLGKAIVDDGGLMPEFMPIYLWGGAFINHYTGDEHVILDGTPRKFFEAEILDSLFQFYGFKKPWAIYLDIDHDETVTRLKKRAVEGRHDDNEAAIEHRRLAFDRDVVPTIEYYRHHPGVNFLDIDGERSIGQIHDDIVKRVGL